MKYTSNLKFFENIDTEEKAYWIGFLYADGYVRYTKRNGGELRLKLSAKDVDHLLKFRNTINSNSKFTYSTSKVKYNGIYSISDSVCFSIYSKKIVDDLHKHGCVNAKTNLIRFPKLDDTLKYHFIRGYFDGDGSIHKIKNRPNSFYVNIVSNKLFIEDLYNILGYGKIINYKNYSILYFRKNKYVKNFRDILYKISNIYLDRKKDIFDQIIENYVRKNEYNNCKKYLITDEYGNDHIVENLNKFCKENNLKYSTMSNLSRGIGKNHKGWSCKFL